MTIKIDFHLHTIAKLGGKDENFDFSMEWLKKYLNQSKLDAIAVTNHNLFDDENFQDISDEMDNIAIFPGIELDLKSKSGGSGHVNLIYPNDLKFRQELISATTNMDNLTKDESISIEDFFNWFPSYRQGIFVFETGKANSMRVPEELKNVTAVAGVQNGLKFQKIWNENSSIVPVLFSDGHATLNGGNKSRSDINLLKEKNTYIQADNAAFDSIKNAVQNKENVNIVPGLVHTTTTISGVTVSTGLNLIVGRRGSGKTYFLDNVEKDNPERIYRISQFESTKLDQFLNREQKNRGELAIKKWSEQNKNVLDAIRDFVEDESPIGNLDLYLKELHDYATDYVKSQSRNRPLLFSEQSFDLQDLKWVENALRKMKELIESSQIWDYVNEQNKYRSVLIDLYEEVRLKYINEELSNRLKSQANEVILNIKTYVQSVTGQRILPEYDFQTEFRRQVLKKKINQWGRELSEETIDVQKIWGYQIVTSINAYRSASELQKGLATRNRVSDALDLYQSGNLSEYLKLLKSRMMLNTNDLVPALIQRNTNLLTEDGKRASGGQAVALALSLSLEEATSKDVILVDEPEASLDNAFIKTKLIPKLRELSKSRTVFVITHNSTLGSLLAPDYLIVAKKGEDGKHEIFSGEYSSKLLSRSDGETVKSFDDFIDAMEAGLDTFKEKGIVYSDLQDN